MRNIALRQLVLATVLLCSFHVFTQLAAVYFYVWEFQDFVNDEVKFAPFRKSDMSNVSVNIIDAARYYNLELDPKQIKISKTATIPGMNWNTLGVDVTYTARVDLSLFKQPLRFHTKASVVY